MDRESWVSNVRIAALDDPRLGKKSRSHYTTLEEQLVAVSSGLLKQLYQG